MNLFGVHVCMDEVRMVAPFVPPVLLTLVAFRQRLQAAAASCLGSIRKLGA
jgi:hypothetical protein